MTEEVIEYKSECRHSKELTEVRLDKGSKDGLNWEWTFFPDYCLSPSSGKLEQYAFLKWKFDWDELKKQGVEGFDGEITALFFLSKQAEFVPNKWKVKLTTAEQPLLKKMVPIKDANHTGKYYFKFEFSFKKILKSSVYAPKHHDAVLVVEGNKINVNKTYLSMRSEFFDALFNSGFKEKSMEEIPIEDVKYENFQCLLDIIHPTKPTQPTSQTARILLELADRFMIPAVTSQVENHLLTFSDLPFFQTMLLADDFLLNYLLDHCLDQLTTLETIGLLKTRTERFELSEDCKAKLFDRALPFFK